MDYTLVFDGSAPDLVIELRGAVDAEGLIKLNTELAADQRFKPGLSVLVDLSRVDVAALADDDLALAAEPVTVRDWYAPPLAVAILAPTDELFNRARLWRAHLGGSRSRRQIFKTRAGALEWLAAVRPTGRS